jgi:TPP-dependent pyruvate/acetoin dehydrogenase alpha subunit
LPGVLVDGNDVLAVRDVVARAAERARRGEGPTVIEALTYRHYGHSRTDPGAYRPAEEVQEWLARDPLLVTRRQLMAAGVSEADVDAADARASRVAADAAAGAQAAPAAVAGEAFTDVWADGGWAWRN